MGKTERVNCFQCVHYANTWRQDNPRSCRFFGFKTTRLPSEVVFASTGMQCNSFRKREKKKN